MRGQADALSITKRHWEVVHCTFCVSALNLCMSFEEVRHFSEFRMELAPGTLSLNDIHY